MTPEAIRRSRRPDGYGVQAIRRPATDEVRFAMPRAIVANPMVIVGDEPTGNLDAFTTEQILALIQRLNAELGMTMLIVTHDAKVAAIAKRQLRLESRKLIESGREVSVVSAEQLAVRSA